jgi:hypothetical protein
MVGRLEFVSCDIAVGSRFLFSDSVPSATTPIAALFAGELDEAKGELSPISP